MAISNILFDFDGVILDSMPIRDKGFEMIFEEFPKEQVQELLHFHQANGGLSRYVKIRYFFQNIRKESITEEDVVNYATLFSKKMRAELINPSLLIMDSVDFIKKNHTQYTMHIVSGSDQNELRYLCKVLGIDMYFKTIEGSPTDKNTLVKNIIDVYGYSKEQTVLIGDSVNDRDAAEYNDIEFLGYNNSTLDDPAMSKYINSFKSQSLL